MKIEIDSQNIFNALKKANPETKKNSDRSA